MKLRLSIWQYVAIVAALVCLACSFSVRIWVWPYRPLLLGILVISLLVAVVRSNLLDFRRRS